MIFWRGWGILGVVLFVGALFVAQWASGNIEGYPTYLKSSEGEASIMFILGGVLNIFLGLRLNRNSGGHTLYFLPLEVLGFLSAVCGVIIFLVYQKA